MEGAIEAENDWKCLFCFALPGFINEICFHVLTESIIFHFPAHVFGRLGSRMELEEGLEKKR
jgi:hypothetical protein